MSTSRQDAWTKEEDTLLAETVLTYIRDGRTQLEAFKEVARRLVRTPAACGFRWNASVRKVYESAVEQAKKDRKKIPVTSMSFNNDQSNEQITLEAAISLLEKVKGNVTQLDQSVLIDHEKYEHVVNENERLRDQLNAYQKVIKEIKNIIDGIQEVRH